MKTVLAGLACCLAACLFVGALAGAEKKPPAVKDAKSGLSFSVDDDKQTLLAKNEKGELVWKTHVIKAAGEPKVGKPEVRHLSLKDGKVRAIYGKHSYGDFDIKTGKFLGGGSD